MVMSNEEGRGGNPPRPPEKIGKVIERLVDGGFEAPIRRGMNDEEYQGLLERALDGEKYASCGEYVARFRMVVREVSEDLFQDLRICMHLQGMEEGIVEFLDRLRIRVKFFVEEMEDLLRQHVDAGFPPMEEPVEIELEDPVLEQNPQAHGLVFRFWAPEGTEPLVESVIAVYEFGVDELSPEGTEPLVEFTCRDPEARADYVLTDVEALVASSYLGYLRRMVECVLHLQKTIKRGE